MSTINVILRIRRFDPEGDATPRFQDFDIVVEPDDRLLDALVHVKMNFDTGLAFRKSCAHGICGSDAMFINGSERLACKTLIKDVARESGAVITVEPLRGLPVQKDLMVDQEKFFQAYRSVKPYLINDMPVEGRERAQSPRERARFDELTNCILCAACYSSCPVIRDKNPDFIGPAAIVSAARFTFDSRDLGFEERLPVLDDPDGVWPCENHFNCTRVCPRLIKVTKCINEMKSTLKKRSGNQPGDGQT